MKYRIPVSRLVQHAALAAGISTLPALSLAQGLPTIDPPSRGTGSGIMQTMDGKPQKSRFPFSQRTGLKFYTSQAHLSIN